MNNFLKILQLKNVSICHYFNSAKKFVIPYISIFPNVTADSEGNFMPFFVNFFYCFQPYKSLKPVDSMTEAEL